MKIYTKTGDDGSTSLFDGTRVDKCHDRVSLYGEIDELNSCLGVATSFCQHSDLSIHLKNIQRDLFALGAQLANPKHKKQKDKADFNEDKITLLEEQIDKMESVLEKMTNFILPGGSHLSAFLHLARTICRRAERHLVAFARYEECDLVYLHYLNRLSDYLFVVARYANHLDKVQDIAW